MVLLFSPPQEFRTCARKEFVPGEEHTTRIFQQSVLLLMLEGTLRFREAGVTIEVHPGEYYIQREGLLQEGVPLDDPPVYDYIHFNGTYGEGNGLPLRGTFSADAVLPLLDRLRDGGGQVSDPFRTRSDFCRLLSILLSGNVHARDERQTAERVYRYLETEYPSHHPLAELSRKFGYAEDYLIRLFRERYGIPPHRALTEIRLEQARWLLENTSISAEKIALSVGYTDFSVFYRAFRKKNGISPGSVRKKETK